MKKELILISTFFVLLRIVMFSLVINSAESKGNYTTPTIEIGHHSFLATGGEELLVLV